MHRQGGELHDHPNVLSAFHIQYTILHYKAMSLYT